MAFRILIPVDGARHSSASEEYALRLFEVLPFEAILLNVLDSGGLDYHGIQADFKEAVKQTKKRIAEKTLYDASQPFKERGIPFERRMHEGNPAKVICQVAEEEACDLVLICEKQSRYMGSITTNVLHRCQRPVLLVKRPEEG